MLTHQLFKTQLKSVSVTVSIGAALLFLVNFPSAVKADDEADEKAALIKAEEMIKDAGCYKIGPGSKLNGSVYLIALNDDILAYLDKIGIEKDDVHQVRVRMNDGRQFFLVQPGSNSYQCKVGAELPVRVLRHPVEPVTDAIVQFNPCCTYTYGGDAQAQWFNLLNCPLYKPKKVANSICGH